MSDNGCIYIVWNIKNTYAKIGNTTIKNFGKRIRTYKINEINYDDTSHKIWQFLIKKSHLSCGSIDTLIRQNAIKNGKPYKYCDGTGGTELYFFNGSPNKLSDFLRENHIDIELREIKLASLNKERKIQHVNVDYTIDIVKKEIKGINEVPEYIEYSSKDVFRKDDYKFINGLSEKIELDDMLKFAKKMDCHGLVKNGKGRWYLRKKSFDELTNKLNSMPDIEKYKSIKFYTIK